MEYQITDDVTLNDAIRYAQEIYDPEVIASYIKKKTRLSDLDLQAD